MKTPRMIITQKDLDQLMIKSCSTISRLLAGKGNITLRELNNGLKKFYEVRVKSKDPTFSDLREFNNYDNAKQYFLQLCKGA